MKYKRGQGWLTEKTLSIVLGIVGIIILLFLATKIYGAFFGSEDKQIAQGWVDDLYETLEGMGIGQQEDYSLMAPKGWLLVLFSEEDAKKPEACLGACVCICPKRTFGGYNCEKGVCKTLSKNLEYNKEQKEINIPSGMLLKVSEKFFSILFKEELKTETKKIETNPNVEVIKTYSLSSLARSSAVTVDRIVLHHTAGSTFESAYSTLNRRGLSVHYIIDKDGKIYYLIDEKRLASHATSYNSRSIGIEIVNTGEKDDPFTDMQYASIKSLIEDIAKRWPSIKIDNEYVIGHFEIKENTGDCRKWDPSPNFDWSKIGLPTHITSDIECKNTVNIVREMGEFGYTIA